MVNGFFEKENVLLDESYTNGKIIEYPQYTKPETVDNIKVPSVLLSGNHQKIANWKDKNKIKFS
jgi:tRNA (guanine37-N1)-methyltransferase